MIKIFRYVGPADYITIVNGLLGFLGIMYIIDKNFRMAFILILAVILLDGLDGWLARYLKSKKQLGKYLDSIADTLSFSFAPAVLIYTIFYDLDFTSFNYWPNALVVFTCFTIVGFGMVRLAWFVEYGRKYEYFQGLPTPALALFVIIILQPEIQLWMSQVATLLAALSVALITMTDLKYPKLNQGLPAVVVCALILTLILVIAFEFTAGLSTVIIITTLGLLLAYIILGPVLIYNNSIK